MGALLPLILIPVLSLLRLNVKLSMSAAILTAVVLALFVQDVPPQILLRQLILGYASDQPEIDVLLHGGGVLSMARAMHPDSAGSQFFIMHKKSPHLDGAYAAFGKITEGMDVVNKIADTRNASTRPPPT